MKEVRQTVNIFFYVPDDYVVTDTEYLGTLITDLRDENGTVISKGQSSFESIETVDVNEESD